MSENSILFLIERKKKMSGQFDKKFGLEMQESCNLSPIFLKAEEKSQTPKKIEKNSLGQ